MNEPRCNDVGCCPSADRPPSALGIGAFTADIIKHADAALYQAKRAGGDQYAVSHPARPDRAVS
jgi:hypothetical protein